MIFGNWNPFGGFLGAILFALADALQIKLETIADEVIIDTRVTELRLL